MKKRNLNSLKLNKQKISTLKKVVTGGRVPVDSDCSSFGNGECEKTLCRCETQNEN
ncbi:MAG: hypothetical protein AAF617_02985 [Bacteroidota bacterium]